MSFETFAISGIEALSLLASALLVCAFVMTSALPLRLAAAAASAVFIVYAALAQDWGLLLLHGVLLPLNLFRAWQHMQSYRQVRATDGGRAEVAALTPLMRGERHPSGSVLFLKGDHADRIFYIVKGSVDIPEMGKSLGPGALFGEVGLFTPDRNRTASAVCAEDCELLVISDRDIVKHCMKDPAFGLYLTRLIAGRMAENQG